MPVYNGADKVEAAVRSALNQVEFETTVLVIDDGSTDDSVDVVQKLEGEFPGRVTLIQKENGGPAAARNLGIQQSTSEWIAFLDHDDMWKPDKLQKQFAAAAASNADLVVTGCTNFGETEHVAETRHAPSPERLRNPFRCLLFGNYFTLSTVLVRRQHLIDVGLFHEEWKGVEDWDLWLRLARNGTVMTSVDEPLVEYLWHTGSLSRKQDSMQRQRQNLIHKHLNSEAGRQVPFTVRRQAIAIERTHSAWAMASSGSFADAALFYAQSLLAWPLNLNAWKGLLKCGLRRI